MLNKIFNKLQNDKTLLTAIKVENNIGFKNLSETYQKLIDETTNEEQLYLILKSALISTKDSSNNIEYSKNEKIEKKVQRIRNTTTKKTDLKAILTFQGKYFRDNLNIITYPGIKANAEIKEKMTKAFKEIPEEVNTIFEGFAGSASISTFFAETANNRNYKYILTERNKTLYDCIKKIKNNPEKVKDEITNILLEVNKRYKAEKENINELKEISKPYFLELREELNRLESANKNNARKSALFLFLLNNSIAVSYRYNNNKSYMCYGKDNMLSKNIFKSINYFTEQLNKLDLKLLNEDYKQVAKKLDKEKTFLIFDPPYITDQKKVENNRESVIYGEQSFEHQECLDIFKSFKNGIYFNNFNQEFAQANNELYNAESWDRQNRQFHYAKDKTKTENKTREIFLKKINNQYKSS
jgi:hypothetical protein